MTFFGLHFQDLVFYALALILLYAALSVITTRNPVYAALFLVWLSLPLPAFGYYWKRSS